MIAATPKHRPLERLEIRRVERPPGLARERVEPNAVHRSNRCCVRCSQRSRIFTSPSRTTSTAGRGLPHDWLPRARTLARSPARDRPASRFGWGAHLRSRSRRPGGRTLGAVGPARDAAPAWPRVTGAAVRLRRFREGMRKGLASLPSPCLIDLTPLAFSSLGVARRSC